MIIFLSPKSKPLYFGANRQISFLSCRQAAHFLNYLTAVYYCAAELEVGSPGLHALNSPPAEGCQPSAGGVVERVPEGRGGQSLSTQYLYLPKKRFCSCFLTGISYSFSTTHAKAIFPKKRNSATCQVSAKL